MTSRILIADDHSIVRSGIKALIKEHLTVDQVDEAADENELTTQVRSFPYDLIFLDINMPGSDFVNLMGWLKARIPGTPVIVFTTYPEEMYGERCFQLGAKGFLNKIAPDSEIVFSIKEVLAGRSYVNMRLRKLMVESGSRAKQENPFDNLSDRELEMALLIDSGYKLPEICTTLNIHYSTANTYKRRIFEKLQVHNAVSLSHLMRTYHIGK